MNKEEILIFEEIENLVCKFDSNIEKIKNKLKGVTINHNFGQQLIYADAECPNSRQRRMLLFDIMLHESTDRYRDRYGSYF